MRPFFTGPCTPRLRFQQLAAVLYLFATTSFLESTLIDDPEATFWNHVDANRGPLAPTCSFEAVEASAPAGLVIRFNSTVGPDIYFPRGRHDPMPLHVGMGMWNSRGDMPLRRAIAAMLGDPYAFYESPLFTAYKLLAAGAFHELPSRVYPTTGNDWFPHELPHGYDAFWRAVTARAYRSSAKQAAAAAAVAAMVPLAASEGEAVAMAKALVDDFFDLDAEALDRRFLREDLEDPFFTCHSTLQYRVGVEYYGKDDVEGPRMLLLSPAARGRGLDAGLHRLRHVAADHPAGPAVDAASFAAAVAAYNTPEQALDAPDRPVVALCGDCWNGDFTEMVTPGYFLPRDVNGIEMYDHAFRRVVYGGAAHVVMLAASRRCVTQAVPHGADAASAAAATAVAAGPFFFCSGEPCTADRRYCGPNPLVPDVPRRLVPALGIFYVLPPPTAAEGHDGSDGGGGDSDAAETAAAAAAAAALAAERARRYLSFWKVQPRRRRRAVLPPVGHARLLLRLHGILVAAPEEYRLDDAGGGGGGDGGVRNVGALLMGQNAEMEEVMFDAGLARPAVADVLRARERAAAVIGSGGGGGGGG